MTTVIFVILFAVIIGAGIFMVVSSKKGNKKASVSNKSKIWVGIYSKLNSFPLTSTGVRKVSNSLKALSVYSIRELYAKAAEQYVKGMVMTAVIIAGSFILFDDMVAVIICAALAMSIYSVRLDKSTDKVNFKVYVELRKAISSIRQEYLRLGKGGSVTEAIQEAEYGVELRGIFDEIYNILTTANGELRLKEFFEKVPFRPIQTLASICYDINNIGDEIDAHGQSNFVQALTYMSEDVNMELSRMRYQKSKFGPIEYLTLVPVPLIKVIESFFQGIMPGTSLIYQGTLGYIIRTVILVLCIVCYNIIARINTVQSIKEDDRNEMLLTMLNNDTIMQLTYDITPKNKSRKKVARKLAKALSRKSIEEFYLSKVVYAIGMFVLAVVALATTVQMGKQNMLSSVQQLSLVATDEMEMYSKESLLEMDNRYIEMADLGAAPTGDELHSYILSYMSNLTDLEIIDQESRLQTKYKTIKNAYFKWQYMIVAFVIGIIGWMVPNISLKMRAWLVETESEDDFLQLQTLMTIIMHTDCDTLGALEQLCQVSRIHKDILLYCYHSYPSDPELELARLESRTTIVEFKRFIGKLKLTVNDLSLREAFSDLGIERNYIMDIRDMTMRATIDRKRALCGILSLLPIGALVLGEFLVPLGYLGYLEFSKALGAMNGL